MTFQAPWSRQLKWLTVLATAILLGIPFLLLAKAPAAESRLYDIAILLPPAIFLLSALFAIRGYRIERDSLLILRPGWHTRIPLKGLAKVEVDSEAMGASIRLFGNGGLFAFTGLYRNSKLGRYRAFATDTARAVVLRYPERTLVVTPDRPEQFAAALKQKVTR
ncbi:PH domain-containing protein [Microbulbifer donghaiensis]|uniref:PH domain-containing protein n=1 Tax=Microbulbifer donghaiensis TaxID=494016 RepID=A0A1M4WIQ6_9GAMM|nr:PH domain-containing protein [Microbulbifer donghaiensis]SHE80943.1 PH domain-containing protein [Microbulbifer donghaiensis]